MESQLISVIIPVYNVESFLTECVESVLNQTYTNLEVILVDDGSTDQSGRLCDEFALKDQRIKVIHKLNGGLSDARNAGIDICNGEYISFIDSDDYVASDYIKCLYDLLTDNHTLLSACSYFNVIQDEIHAQENKIITQKCIKEQALKCILTEREMSTSAWGKLFHRSLFEDIRFPVGRIYEDLFTLWRLIDYLEYVVYTTTPKYYYRMNPQSITNTSFSCKNLDFIDAHYSIMEYVRDKYPHLYKYAIRRFVRYNVAYLYRAMKIKYFDKKVIRLLQNNIRHYIFQYLLSSYSINSKLFALMATINLRFCALVVKY